MIWEHILDNTKSFKNIECIHAVAYFEDGFVNFSNNELSYNQRISETGISTQAISIESLKETYNLLNIDLMKIDIEGGEIDLLSKNNSWLSSIENIIIEIHNPYTASDLDKDIKPFGFKIMRDKHFVFTAVKG